VADRVGTMFVSTSTGDGGLGTDDAASSSSTPYGTTGRRRRKARPWEARPTCPPVTRAPLGFAHFVEPVDLQAPPRGVLDYVGQQSQLFIVALDQYEHTLVAASCDQVTLQPRQAWWHRGAGRLDADVEACVAVSLGDPVHVVMPGAHGANRLAQQTDRSDRW
jgi:hypothetical protein